jgi:hypothetical protein
VTMRDRPTGVARVFTWLVLLLSLVACGTGIKDLNRDSPVDCAFVLQEKPMRLSFYRGRPVILVLMRTSEVVSQIYMQHVSEAFKKTAGKLVYVILTVEQREAPFIEAYRDFEKLPFPIGIAEAAVKFGQSALGIIPGAPITYFIDESGLLVDAIPGVMEADALIDKAERFSKW